MKKRIFCLVLIALLLCTAITALAARTVGPGVTVTLASGTKTSNSAAPTVTVGTFYTESGEAYVFWVTNSTRGKQVTPTYYFNSAGSKDVYYMRESINAGDVPTGDRYAALARSSANTLPDEVGEITLSRFVP